MVDIPELFVQHFPKEGDASWSGSGTTLFPESAVVDLVTGKKTDKVSLSVSGLSTDVQSGDRIKVYMGTGSAFPSNTDLKIDAVMTETDYNNVVQGPRWKLTGEDRIRTLLSDLEPARYEIGGATGDTSSSIIQHLLSQVNNAVGENGDLKVFWYDASTPDAQGRAANSVTTKTFNYFKDFTEVLEMINELSMPEYTGGGFYYYFVEYDPVNDKNFFYWRSRGDASTVTLSEGDWINCSFSHQTYDIINSLIINVGTDSEGNGMKTLAIDPASRITHGAKWKYEPRNYIAKEFLDTQRGSVGWTSGGAKYPDGADYPFTSLVPTTLTFGAYSPGQYPILSNDSQFLSFMRQECKAQGKVLGDNLIKYFVSPTYRFKVGVDGSTYGSSFVKGSLVTIVFDNNILRKNYEATNTINVRVVGLTHSFSNTGWVVKVALQEDEPGLEG